MILAYPGPPNKTMGMVRRNAFLEAVNDPELVIDIQAHKPMSLNSAVQVAQYMEVMLHLA